MALREFLKRFTSCFSVVFTTHRVLFLVMLSHDQTSVYIIHHTHTYVHFIIGAWRAEVTPLWNNLFSLPFLPSPSPFSLLSSPCLHLLSLPLLPLSSLFSFSLWQCPLLSSPLHSPPHTHPTTTYHPNFPAVIITFTSLFPAQLPTLISCCHSNPNSTLTHINSWIILANSPS